MRKCLLTIFLFLFSVCIFAQQSNEKSDSILVQKKYSLIPEIKIYPNPVIEYFHVEYSIDYIRNAKIQVYNSLGKIVITKDVEDKKGSEKIYVTELENGLYFCSLLIDDNLVSTKKLIINR